jgi:hypothetical protein
MRFGGFHDDTEPRELVGVTLLHETRDARGCRAFDGAQLEAAGPLA